jgi:hypothetical protein
MPDSSAKQGESIIRISLLGGSLEKKWNRVRLPKGAQLSALFLNCFTGKAQVLWLVFYQV